MIRGRDWCGVSYIIGIPKCGKTTLALALVHEESARRALPYLAIDTAGVRNFRGIPRSRSVDDVVRSLWHDHVSTAWTPDSMDDVDRICRAVRAGKRALVLIDEAHVWLHGRKHSGELLRLMRATQHALCHVYLTTHHYTGDIPSEARSCAPTLYVFRCTERNVLKTLDDDFYLPPELIRSLPQFQYLQRKQGF